jgi:CheY-like chemotaxis protein
MTDTGHGMDRDTLSHVFEPFFTTKGIGQGTGLGLSTVYGIVKQSEGYIWAYSEPGKGSTFKIYLRPVAEPMEATEGGQGGETPAAAGELILVVEDEAAVRSIAARALKDAGFRVREAGTGKEALDLLAASAERIALIVTDVVMPEISGKDLAERVARIAPGTAVMFTSGYTDGDIVRRGLLAPDAAFIQKPFTPHGLVAAVRERLTGQAAPPRG